MFCTDSLRYDAILAMTANAFDGSIRECLDADMDDHMSKPIGEKDLLHKVAKYLAGREG
jgi:hypothetical protein